MKVLIMDDDSTVRAACRRMAAALGIEVVTTNDGSEALQEIERARESGQPFDVCVLDLRVPGGMGGLETLKAIRDRSSCKRVVLMTGDLDHPAVRNWRKLGFNGTLLKPFTSSQFRDATMAK
ncbi:MAG: hypothetical protein Kow0069_04140 [Promethearchaeota archaeon]